MNYDSVVGYVPADSVNMEKLKAKLLIAQSIIETYYRPNAEDRLLIAGCGSGEEALGLSELLKMKTVGIDITLPVARKINPSVELFPMDLTNIAYPDGSFGVIYSYHVLEHVPHSQEALKEISRVLKQGGVLLVGFPNKNRIVGYIGHHNNVSLKEVISWNLHDYRDRLAGRFENKFGAHAGFTQREFLEMSTGLFKSVHLVRNDYMLMKYRNYSRLISLFISLGIEEFVFPSNYFVCTK